MQDLTPPDAFEVAQLIPEAHEELRVLQDAAESLWNSRTLEPGDRSTAIHAAHRLTQLLELAGAVTGAQQAREILTTLDHPGLPQPERLQEQVQALATLLFSDRTA